MTIGELIDIKTFELELPTADELDWYKHGLVILLARFLGHLQDDRLRYQFGRVRDIYEQDALRLLQRKLPPLVVIGVPEDHFSSPTIMTIHEWADFCEKNQVRAAQCLRIA